MSLPLIPGLGAQRQITGGSVAVPPELQPFMPGADRVDGPGEVGGTDKTTGTEGVGGTPFESFSKALEKELDTVNADMDHADQKIASFVSGDEHSVHEVMIAMNKADTSFRMLTTITRRVVEAYQEVMRMQV